MLVIVIADNKETRKKHIEGILAPLGDSEILRFDDAATNITLLEEYLYPSLFSLSVPVIISRFLLSEKHEGGIELYKKLAASPTVFIFEEFALPAPLVTQLTKSGALIHAAPKSTKKSTYNAFAAADCITAPDKKSRWIAYREALETSPIEAVLGILYWKARSLSVGHSSASVRYQKLYRQLIMAHSTAWQNGTPLELAIEKVILSE